jgi:hypothetical protein
LTQLKTISVAPPIAAVMGTTAKSTRVKGSSPAKASIPPADSSTGLFMASTLPNVRLFRMLELIDGLIETLDELDELATLAAGVAWSPDFLRGRIDRIKGLIVHAQCEASDLRLLADVQKAPPNRAAPPDAL